MRFGKIGILLMCSLLLTTGFSTAAVAVDWVVGGQAVGSTGQLGSTDNYDVQFITNNAVRMTITNTGDVGIGIATPSHKLQISDSSSTAGRAGLYVDQTGAMSGTGYGLFVSKSGASTNNVAAMFSASGATNNYGVIVDQGDSGFGTKYPQEMVTVGTGYNLATEMAVPTGVAAVAASGGTLTTGWYYYIVVSEDGVGGSSMGGTEASVYVDNARGENAATITWTAVTGAYSYRVYGRATGAQNMYWVSTDTSYTDLGSAGTAGTVPAVTTAYVNKFSASGDSWIIGGEFGIGTAIPSVQFEVNKTTSPSSDTLIELARIGDKDHANRMISFGLWDSNGDPAIQSIDEESGPPSEQSVPLYINPIGGDVLMVENWATMGGKVGIGTTSPDELLHVADSAKIEEGIQLGTPSSISAMLQIEHTGFTYPLRITDNGDSPTFFVVDGDGEVGIGTSTPDSLLELEDGSQNTWLTMDEADANPTSTQLDADDSISMYNKADKLVFAYNNGGVMTYIYLSLDGSDTTWYHGTTAPT